MAYLANLLVPQSSLEEVKRRLSEVMEEDGYEQLQRAALFPYDDEEDVRFFLISKGEEVVVLGSGFKGEMKRIQKMLRENSVLLWQEDGRWGFRAHSQGAELGRFENHQAGRFRNNLPNGTTDWLAESAKQFSEAKEWREFRSCLRYGRWFADWAVGKFCAGYGLPLAALSFHAVDEVWDGNLALNPLERWSIQLLAFKRLPEAGPKPVMEPEGPLDEDESEESWTSSSCLWALLVLLFAPVLLILIFLFMPLLAIGLLFFQTPWVRRVLWGKGQRVRDQFLKAVTGNFSKPIKLSKGKLYNTVHLCSVTLPEGMEAYGELIDLKPDPFRQHSLVFDFYIYGLDAHCTAHKPNKWRDPVGKSPQRMEESRSAFQVGTYDGTKVLYKVQTAQSFWHQADWFIHTPQAIYKFYFSSKINTPLSEEAVRKMDELVRSFELESGGHADEGAVVCP